MVFSRTQKSMASLAVYREVAMLENGSWLRVDGDQISSDAEICWLSAIETAKRDSIAGVRIVTSCLSLLGSLSIVFLAIARRRVCSQKVHPILVLSVADALLAVLWLAGGTLWEMELSPHSRVACLAISTATVVLECVTINLSLVYALFALAHLRASRLPSALFYPYQTPTAVCHPLKVTLVYLLAWLAPVVVVVVLFLSLVDTSQFIENIAQCSCWCMPDFANVLPMAQPLDRATQQYNSILKKLVLSYACVVFAHYLVVFPLLLATYHCTLNLIRTIRPSNKQSRLSGYYGATEVAYVRGQADAKHRVLLYLLTFIISGFCNCLLSLIIIVHHSVELLSHEPHRTLPLSPLSSSLPRSTSLSNTLLAAFLLQSVTLPLQGFLNAIVYGWTRGDFLQVMAFSSSLSSHPHHMEEERGSDGDCTRTDRETPELLSGTY